MWKLNEDMIGRIWSYPSNKTNTEIWKELGLDTDNRQQFAGNSATSYRPFIWERRTDVAKKESMGNAPWWQTIQTG